MNAWGWMNECLRLDEWMFKVWMNGCLKFDA